MLCKNEAIEEIVLHVWWECCCHNNIFTTKLEETETVARELVDYEALNDKQKFLFLTQPSSLQIPPWARRDTRNPRTQLMHRYLKQSALLLHRERVKMSKRILKNYELISGEKEKYLSFTIVEHVRGAALRSGRDPEEFARAIILGPINAGEQNGSQQPTKVVPREIIVWRAEIEWKFDKIGLKCSERGLQILVI